MSSSVLTAKTIDTQGNTAPTLQDASAAEATTLPPAATNQTNHLPNALCVRETIRRTTRDAAYTKLYKRISNASASQIRTIMSPKTTSPKVVTM